MRAAQPNLQNLGQPAYNKKKQAFRNKTTSYFVIKCGSNLLLGHTCMYVLIWSGGKGEEEE